MIPNGRGSHYITVKNIPALLRGAASTHRGDFYRRNYLHSFAIENRHESPEKVCEKAIIVTPFEDTKILEFNQYQKSNKTPFIIYADYEWLTEKIDGCKNNP